MLRMKQLFVPDAAVIFSRILILSQEYSCMKIITYDIITVNRQVRI